MAKISSSSSSDKKQKRGNSTRLVSRKAARAFIIISTASLFYLSLSTTPWFLLRNLEAYWYLSAMPIYYLKKVSIFSKAADSDWSTRLISEELKMFSRYYQDFCRVSKSSVT